MRLLFTLLIAGPGLLCAQSDQQFLAEVPKSILKGAPNKFVSLKTEHSVPFKRVKNILLVSGEIDGKTGTFILDTGAPGLVLNEDKKSLVEKELTGAGVFNTVKIGWKKILNFKFGNEIRTEVESHTLDISHLSKSLNEDIKGLLGYELYKGKCLFINQDEHYVELIKKEKTLKKQLGKSDLKIPFAIQGHLPVVKVKIENKNLFFGIDTGSSIHILDKKAADKLKKLEKTEEFEYVKSLENKLVKKVGKIFIDKISLKNENEWRVPATIMNLDHLNHPDFDWKVQGLLGVSIFSGYKYVLFDYKRMQILLWK